MNVALAILGLLVIALCIGVPILMGRRAWHGQAEFEEQVDEIDDQAAMRDYRL